MRSLDQHRRQQRPPERRLTEQSAHTRQSRWRPASVPQPHGRKPRRTIPGNEQSRHQQAPRARQQPSGPGRRHHVGDRTPDPRLAIGEPPLGLEGQRHRIHQGRQQGRRHPQAHRRQQQPAQPVQPRQRRRRQGRQPPRPDQHRPASKPVRQPSAPRPGQHPQQRRHPQHRPDVRGRQPPVGEPQRQIGRVHGPGGKDRRQHQPHPPAVGQDRQAALQACAASRIRRAIAAMPFPRLVDSASISPSSRRKTGSVANTSAGGLPE